ncbi:MAG: DNA-binding response regulator [Lysobacteraceae bacterium]|nr:MAG: DNA-binding response regulator [Xanthomonadaceae bacterium]
MSVPTVLLVDDQALFREGLRTLLSTRDEVKVVGEARDGQEAVEQFGGLRPDVVLMDLRMPVMDGVRATEAIVRQDPDAKVIVLTTFDADEEVFDGLKAGAVAYLLKDCDTDTLIEAIRTAVSGESFLQPAITSKVVDELNRLRASVDSSGPRLNELLGERELQILRLMVTGLSNREIAETIHLAEGTVKNYASQIFQKLEVKDRLQAVLRSRELGLV